jgi:hypothetical protein
MASSMSNSIWATLSAIDCNEHVAKKGQFSYLSWTWAWAMVKDLYPYANYELLDDTVYPDGSMEVRVQVSINAQVAFNSGKLVFNTVSHTMWLPVLDFKNNAIKNPNAMDINSARMRCLVKCLAMFGLGHYIYAGESLPQERQVTETDQMILAGAQINACFEADDLPGAAQLWDEWDHSELAIIARAPSNGGQLTTANRVKMKDTPFRLALNEVRGISMEGVGT